MANDTLETAEFRRGPGGRPTRAEAERRHRALLETAACLFLDRGLDAVSLDEIARRAGVAKRFIYARYSDKSGLFAAAFEHRFADRLETLHAFEPPRCPADKGLFQLGRQLLDVGLQPDLIALHRLFVTAAPRFPGLARLFIDRYRYRATQDIERVLRFYADRGEIELRHPQMMAEQFFISTVGIPQRLALLGLREAPDQENRRLRVAIRLFIDGCRAQRPSVQG